MGDYYDTETGLYYVSSRYYDPEVGRFINADDINYLGADGSLTGYNLFAYCDNNPVMGYDPTGTINWANILKATVIVVGVTAAVTLTVATAGGTTEKILGVNCMSNNTYSFFRFVFDYICSFFDGAFGGTPEPITSENRRIFVVSIIGAVLFVIVLFGVLFFIDRKLDLDNRLSWLISIVCATFITLVYLAFVFYSFFV